MEIAVIAAAYLIGSVSFAILVSRVYALPDPRSYGSKNPGATNVLRSGKRAAAGFTLLGDGGKGWAAVMLAQLAGPFEPWVIPMAGVAVVAGHMFPVFHRFHGGKGVATAAGVLLGFDPWLGLGTLATWLAIFVFFRVSSLAALVAAVFAPLYAGFLFGLKPLVPATLAIALLLVWRHKENLVRLVRGEEPGFGGKR
ncbi:MAG: glycerol-3-phosphate 1-O-acyltransferase PlsY [Burkholderiales bacterium]